MNLNKVIIVGRVTADPELRSTPAGQSVSSFSVATNRVWTDKNGEKKEETEFHNIVAWARTAEIANQFLKRGGLVLIEGRLQTRSWEDKQAGQKRYRTEIIAERLQLGPAKMFQSSGEQTGFSANSSKNNQKSKNDLPEISIDEEDIRPEDIPF